MGYTIDIFDSELLGKLINESEELKNIAIDQFKKVFQKMDTDAIAKALTEQVIEYTTENDFLFSIAQSAADKLQDKLLDAMLGIKFEVNATKSLEEEK